MRLRKVCSDSLWSDFTTKTEFESLDTVLFGHYHDWTRIGMSSKMKFPFRNFTLSFIPKPTEQERLVTNRVLSYTTAQEISFYFGLDPPFIIAKTRDQSELHYLINLLSVSFETILPFFVVVKDESSFLIKGFGNGLYFSCSDEVQENFSNFSAIMKYSRRFIPAVSKVSARLIYGLSSEINDPACFLLINEIQRVNDINQSKIYWNNCSHYIAISLLDDSDTLTPDYFEVLQILSSLKESTFSRNCTFKKEQPKWISSNFSSMNDMRNCFKTVKNNSLVISLAIRIAHDPSPEATWRQFMWWIENQKNKGKILPGVEIFPESKYCELEQNLALLNMCILHQRNKVKTWTLTETQRKNVSSMTKHCTLRNKEEIIDDMIEEKAKNKEASVNDFLDRGDPEQIRELWQALPMSLFDPEVQSAFVLDYLDSLSANELYSILFNAILAAAIDALVIDPSSRVCMEEYYKACALFTAEAAEKASAQMKLFQFIRATFPNNPSLSEKLTLCHWAEVDNPMMETIKKKILFDNQSSQIVQFVISGEGKRMMISKGTEKNYVAISIPV